MPAVTEIRTKAFNTRIFFKAGALVAGLVVAASLVCGASSCLAQSDLVRLVPPDVPVIAGLHRMAHDQANDALWLATRNNLDDLSRLVTLTDADPDRSIDEVIVADWASSRKDLDSHLLIAHGRFSLASVTATIAHPTRVFYDGAPVLVVDARGGSKPAPRWFAVPRPELALFGTPAAVQLALDRFRSRATADPQVLERLRNAHDHDAAWSSIVLEPRSLQEQTNLHADADNLTPCLSRMREVDLGIQMGKTVTIDLHTQSRNGSDGAMECMTAAIFKNYTPQMRVSVGGDREPSMRLTLARAEYDRWLDAFRKSEMNETLEAFISAPDRAAERNSKPLETVR